MKKALIVFLAALLVSPAGAYHTFKTSQTTQWVKLTTGYINYDDGVYLSEYPILFASDKSGNPVDYKYLGRKEYRGKEYYEYYFGKNTKKVASISYLTPFTVKKPYVLVDTRAARIYSTERIKVVVVTGGYEAQEVPVHFIKSVTKGGKKFYVYNVDFGVMKFSKKHKYYYVSIVYVFNENPLTSRVSVTTL